MSLDNKINNIANSDVPTSTFMQKFHEYIVQPTAKAVMIATFVAGVATYGQQKKKIQAKVTTRSVHTGIHNEPEVNAYEETDRYGNTKTTVNVKDNGWFNIFNFNETQIELYQEKDCNKPQKKNKKKDAQPQLYHKKTEAKKEEKKEKPDSNEEKYKKIEEKFENKFKESENKSNDSYNNVKADINNINIHLKTSDKKIDNLEKKIDTNTKVIEDKLDSLKNNKNGYHNENTCNDKDTTVCDTTKNPISIYGGLGVEIIGKKNMLYGGNLGLQFKDFSIGINGACGELRDNTTDYPSIFGDTRVTEEKNMWVAGLYALVKLNDLISLGAGVQYNGITGKENINEKLYDRLGNLDKERNFSKELSKNNYWSAGPQAKINFGKGWSALYQLNLAPQQKPMHGIYLNKEL